jgi:hypothetical protein
LNLIVLVDVTPRSIADSSGDVDLQLQYRHGGPALNCEKPQGLKPSSWSVVRARLKSCPSRVVPFPFLALSELPKLTRP